VTFTILFLGLLVLIPLVIGIAYHARNVSEKRRRASRGEPKNATPVTLDRNPEMPHRPGATS
jgi:hypothetical protein